MWIVFSVVLSCNSGCIILCTQNSIFANLKVLGMYFYRSQYRVLRQMPAQVLRQTRSKVLNSQESMHELQKL